MRIVIGIGCRARGGGETTKPGAVAGLSVDMVIRV